MQASNWKYRYVRHTRGGALHNVKVLTCYSSYNKPEANISIDAQQYSDKNLELEIYLEIQGLTIVDLKKLKSQVENAISEIESMNTPEICETLNRLIAEETK